MAGLLQENAALVTGGLLALLAILVLRRPIGGLLRLALRTTVGVGVLAGMAQVGGFLGISLGVNLFNGLVLGVLGAPGLGLLLMLDWMLKV